MMLPAEEAERLRSLREEDFEKFKARIRDLRAKGWTYSSLALPFLSPRATAQVWDRRAASTDVIPVSDDVPSPPEISRKKKREVYTFMRPEVPDAEAARLAELSSQVRVIRGWTPQDHPARAAAVELEDLIAELSERGVSYASIARAMGVTYRAVAARMERRNEKAAESGEMGDDSIVAVA
jgi:hypothetical protein